MERGELIDGCFWIDRCLHRSAAIDVYRTVDVRDSSSVLVRIHSDLSSSGLEHFQRTCATLSAHPHPALERVVAWGTTTKNARYAAIAVPSGPTLDEALGQGLIASDALPIATRCLEALAHLHTLGLAHGEATSRSIVMPLGLAAATTLVDVMLVPRSLIAAEDSLPSVQVTPASHLAPERVRAGYRPTPESDVFALGCVFYRMLTGRLPFTSLGVVGTFLRILYEDPDPPTSIDGNTALRLSAVAMRMLEKDPSRRPTAREALAELEQGPEAPASSDPASLTSPTRKRGTGLVGLVLCREMERGHASLDREGELDRIQRLLESLSARLDRLNDGTLLVEVPPAGSGEDSETLMRTGRAALVLQASLAAARIVIARGGTGARNIDSAEGMFRHARAGNIVVSPELVPQLERHFDIETASDVHTLWEREPHTRERSEDARRRALRPGVDMPAFSRGFSDFDTEVTIVEHKRRTLEIELNEPAIEQQPTLEMDLSALAKASLGVVPPVIQHDDTDPESPQTEDTNITNRRESDADRG